jgi:predicted dehydrogenase
MRGTFPDAFFSTDARKALMTPGVDAAVIATSPSSHYFLGSMALKMGKHILVEKPLSVSLREAEKLAKEAEKYKKILMVGHTYLYSPRVREVRNILNRGLLGKLKGMCFTRFGPRPALKKKPDVGVLWDYAVHDISIVLYWLGIMPARISAGPLELAPHKPDHGIRLRMQFPGGPEAVIRASWVPRIKTRQIYLSGTKAVLSYNDLDSHAPVKVLGENGVLLPRIDGREPLAAECGDFIKCILGAGVPFSDGYSSLNVLKIVEAAELSVKKGGKPVRIGGAPYDREVAVPSQRYDRI